MTSNELPAEPAPNFVPSLLSAFAVPGYRWLWVSHHLHSTSLMMSRLALGWLMLTLTGSAYYVGLAAGLAGLGNVGFGFFAGALVDRLDKRALFVLCLLVNGLIAMLLGGLLLSGWLALWHVLVAAVIQGAIDSLQASASNTMLYQIVGRARVVNASASKMFSFNLARVTGSALAGLIIENQSLGVCYLWAGLLALLAILPAALIHGQFSLTTAAEPIGRAIKEGLRYAWDHAPVRQLLTLSVMVESFGFAHYNMVPVIAREVLHVGAAELGWLSSVAGLGALVGTVVVASLGDFPHKGRLLGWVTTGAGLGLVVFALSPWYALSLVLSGLLGAALTSYDVLMHALFQLIASDAVRGRVFSLYVLTFGFHPLGGYLAGVIASFASAPVAVGLGGVLIVGYCLRSLRRVSAIRPTAGAPAGD